MKMDFKNFGMARSISRQWPDFDVLFRVGGIGEGVRAQQYPQLFLDFPDRFELAGRVVGGEDFGQAMCRVLGVCVVGARGQHPVRPGLVDPAAATAVDLLREVLPRLGHGLFGRGDQMEMINCHGGAWKPHPQRFPERGRRVDRNDLHAQAPGQRAGEEPVTDALVVPAVDYAQDLPGLEVNVSCHPRFMPDP